MAEKGTTDYAERNRELFAKRQEVLSAIDELADTESTERRRLSQKLEAITYQIVELNRGLVGEYCKSFSAHSPHLADDFFSAGYVGLIAAINNYDASKGASFSHWAFRFIQREVLTEVRKLDHSTISQSDFEKRRAILSAQDELELENPYEAISDEDVAARAKVSVPQARRVLAPTRVLSLDRPTDTGDGSTTAELVESIPHDVESVEDVVTRGLDSTALADITRDVLTPRERFVLVRRFGLDGEPAQTLSSVGALLNRSRESVRMIQSQAMEKLSCTKVKNRLMSEVSLAQDLAHAS